MFYVTLKFTHILTVDENSNVIIHGKLYKSTRGLRELLNCEEVNRALTSTNIVSDERSLRR